MSETLSNSENVSKKLIMIFFVGVAPKLRVANLLKSYSMEELFLHQRTDLQEEEKSKNAKFSTLSNLLVEVNDP